jgi:predicted transcriptional regulator
MCQNFGMSRPKARKKTAPPDLSRRERQILDALYRLGTGSAAEIRELLADPPTYTAVRTHLTLLEEKGHVRHDTDGARYIYSPVVPREEMGQRVIQDVLQNFFNNSVEQVITALVKRERTDLSPADLERLAKLIDEARKEGR